MNIYVIGRGNAAWCREGRAAMGQDDRFGPAARVRASAAVGRRLAEQRAGLGLGRLDEQGVRSSVQSAKVNLVASLGNDDHAITRRGCSAPGSE